MTCIAAIKHGGKVCLGSDSESTWGYVKQDCGSKIHKAGGLVIASTGLAAVGWAIARRFSAPDEIEDTDKYLHHAVRDSIKSTLSDCGLIKTDSGQEEIAGGGSLLIGYRDRLLEVDCTLSFYERSSDCAAMGSGGEVALGSLYTTGLYSNINTEERITTAIEAAQTLAVGVGGDVHIEWT